jgi:diguanylate cyclase
MKSIREFGSDLAHSARSFWRFGDAGRKDSTFHLPADLSLPESDLIERREMQLRYEQQRIEEEELIRIANEEKRQLTMFEQLIGRSHGDAESFGEQLRDTATSMSDTESAQDMVAGLIDLTNSMIAKTRVATEELRSRREEMQGLRESLDDARKRADTDMLTQLANRRCFERTLATQVERAATDKIQLSLVICDIDYFKSINDRFGHPTGDGVLKLLAKILNDHCSRDGMVFRIGGEEFAVILPDQAGDRALQIIDGARTDLNVRRIRQRGTGDFLGHISFSAGVACQLPDVQLGADALFAEADRALYAAKEAGRNRVLQSGEDA